MRKKKIGIALVILLVMAAVLSIRAHAADSPQTVIDADGSGTTISVTDITPREDKQDETKDYTIGSYYPVEVQTAEDHGIQLLIKTFLVPEGTDPQTLVEGNLTQRGISYEVSDILRQDLPGDVETKTVSQTVTLESETDGLDDILTLLNSSMDYHEDGFTGMLALDKSSIRTKETGTSGYSYQLKETKEFVSPLHGIQFLLERVYLTAQFRAVFLIDVLSELPFLHPGEVGDPPQIVQHDLDQNYFPDMMRGTLFFPAFTVGGTLEIVLLLFHAAGSM